jgi:CheY-like chemotaxis protein
MSAVPIRHPAAPPKKKILLVHAVGPHRTLRVSVMRRRGFDVVCAADCEEARLLWHPGSYDLVLLDGKHDAAANQELCRELKSSSPRDKVAFLVGKPEFLASRPADNGAHGETTSPRYQQAFHALIAEASELLPHRHGFIEAVWRMRMVRSVTPVTAAPERPAPVVEVTIRPPAPPPLTFGDAVREFERQAKDEGSSAPG